MFHLVGKTGYLIYLDIIVSLCFSQGVIACLGRGGCHGFCPLPIIHLNSKNQLSQRETASSQLSSIWFFVRLIVYLCRSINLSLCHVICSESFFCYCAHACYPLFSCNLLHSCDVNQSGVQSFAVQTPQGRCSPSLCCFVCLAVTPLGAVTFKMCPCSPQASIRTTGGS